MTVTHDLTMGRKLCEAYGIDPNLCRNITINLPVGEPPVAHMELYFTEEISRKFQEMDHTDVVYTMTL